jgi:hypothetical protein
MGGRIAPRRTKPQTDWVVMPSIAASSLALTTSTKPSKAFIEKFSGSEKFIVPRLDSVATPTRI